MLFRDGIMKSTVRVTLGLLLLTSVMLSQVSVEGRITLWPAKLNISMDSIPDEPIVFKRVQVKNPENKPAVVRSEVAYQNEDLMEEGYSSIPDLSWVSVTPKEMTIPSKSDGFFNISITIPKSNTSQSYNQKWEVLAVFYQVKESAKGAINFQVKLASRVFINTPTNETEKQETPLNLFPLVWFLGMAGLAVATVVFYLRGRYTTYKQKSVVYYLKDKGQKHRKRK